MSTTMEHVPSNQAHHAQGDVIALIGGTIIDGNGGKPIEGGVVLIKDGRISAVGDRSTAIPEAAQTIQADGKFIIPGFVGGSWIFGWVTYRVMQLIYGDRAGEIALEFARIALATGITTLIDWYSPRDDVIAARNLINEGKAIGSRIYVGGNWMGYPAPTSDENYAWIKTAFPPSILERENSRWESNIGPTLIAMTPDEIRCEIRKYIEPGLDLLTIMAAGDYGPHVNYLRFSPRQIEAMIDEAHRAGLPVHMHCMYSHEAIQIGLDAGADSFYFAPDWPKPLPKEFLEKFAKRKIVLPILLMDEEYIEGVKVYFRSAAHQIDLHKEFPENYYANEKAIRDAGILRNFLTFVGGHAPSFTYEHGDGLRHKSWRPHILGEEHFHTLVYAQKCGLKPMEILQAATRNAAMAKRFDKDVGTLEPGKFADLLVLNRNPLEDANNYSSINLVLKEGKVVDRKALLEAPRIIN